MSCSATRAPGAGCSSTTRSGSRSRPSCPSCRPLYPTAQERAAHLLDFVVKDHPFADGNKRIGALLFLDDLRRHGLLVRAVGQPRLADTATAALTLLIAESRPAQKDLMVRLVMSLLGDHGREASQPTVVAEPRVTYGAGVEGRLGAEEPPFRRCLGAH